MDKKKKDEFSINVKKEAHKNYFKHFDRINDKLFTINLSLLAGVIALFNNDLIDEIILIIVILINLILYGLIEYLFINLYIKEYHKGISLKTKAFFNKIIIFSEILTLSTVITIIVFLYDIVNKLSIN